MTTVKATVRGGRLELEQPINLPDGTELLIPVPDATGDDVPVPPEEIARILAAMERMLPFEMTPEEEAEIEAQRQRNKAYTIAHMHRGIDELFQ